MTNTSSLLSALAPTGRIRAAINVGNPILARRQADGSAAGVSVDLAQRLATQLGVALELLVFEAASQSVETSVFGSSAMRVIKALRVRG